MKPAKQHFPQISKRILTAIILLEGISVMTVELGSAQIMIPFFGNTLTLWTTVLGMTLLFLGTGYFLGGIISGKIKKDLFLGWILTGVALFLALMPVISRKIPDISEKMSWDFSWVFTTFLLISAPLILLGTLPAIIIQNYSGFAVSSGRSAGKVFAISTLGNILGAFLLGFWLIPQIGVTKSVVVISFLMMATSLLIWSKEKKGLKLFILFVVLIININNLKQKITLPSQYRLMDFKEGLMGQLVVLDVPVLNQTEVVGWNRLVMNNKMIETYFDLQNQKLLGSYPSYITSLCSINPEGSKVLVVGSGGGTIAKALNGSLKMNVTTVDIDKRMNEIAKKRFGLPPEINVLTDDGRHYIKTTKERYSLIVFDTFRGEGVPANMLTMEFFKEVKQILNPEGFIVFNFYGFLTGSKGRIAKAVYKTIKEAGFQYVSIIPTHEKEEVYRNILFVASVKPINLDKASVNINLNGAPDSLKKVAIQLTSGELNDAVILSDDRPVQEVWIQNSMKLWRQHTYKNLTKDLIEKGVPLFK